MNLPNKLTVARLLMVPVFVAMMMLDSMWGFGTALALFLVATMTDYYDGKIARERNLITNFGKLMDPLADKVLVASAFIMLMGVEELRIPGWTIVAILAREFLVTGARSMAAIEGTAIAANLWGKTKAAIQMVYIGVFLFFATALRAMERFAPERIGDAPNLLAQASFWSIVLVASFTVYSGFQFARSNWKTLNLGMRE